MLFDLNEPLQDLLRALELATEPDIIEQIEGLIGELEGT